MGNTVKLDLEDAHFSHLVQLLIYFVVVEEAFAARRFAVAKAHRLES